MEKAIAKNIKKKYFHFGFLATSIGTIVLIVLTEGWLATSVFLFGYWASLLFYTILGSLINQIVISTFFSKKVSNNNIILKIDEWIEKKIKRIKTISLVKISGIILFIAYNFVVGPLTAILILMLIKIKKKNIELISVGLNFVFFAFWLLVYDGIIKII